MIKLFEDNKLLYSSEKKFYKKSLSLAKKLPNSENEKLIFHLFWRVPGDFGFKQSISIKSIIASHIHKLNNLTINLWSNIDLSENFYLKDILKYLNLKIWNFDEEIKGTILEKNLSLNKNSISDNLCYLESDLFRLLILHKYGGFYVDMDVLVLRDMTPLNSYEFLYQWGTSGFKCFHYHTFEPELRINNAVMRLNKNSDLSLEFLEKLNYIPPNKDSQDWGSNLFSLINKNPILVLPCIWFDSDWGFEGTSFDPFTKHDNIKMFDGAFAWHWHNRWGESIEENSKFDLIRKKIEKKLKRSAE